MTGIPSVADAAECRRAHSGVHRSGRRFVFLHDGTGRRAADADLRQPRDVVRRGFFRHRAARGNLGGFAVSTRRAGRMRRRDRLRRSACSGGASATSKIIGTTSRLTAASAARATTCRSGWTPDATYFAGGGCDTTGKAIWGGDLRDSRRRRHRDARADDAVRRDRLPTARRDCSRTQVTRRACACA